jgi:nitrite reductase/ring-hydroxylating ferredoxin subunit/DMSO/TMAO reductase YedYZ heme-binding membrane subunit
MGLNYVPVLWNAQKKKYDKLIALFVVFYLIIFAVITLSFNSNTSLETLIIRSFGSLSIVMLHVILSIGPLCRLNSRFLPLLYNRRHLGVSMFLIAMVHAVFSIVQFHTLGNVNPLISLFTSNLDYTSLTNFPFQVLGFMALIILFIMAATSHDFWLANLSPKIWKALHMMVYLAYALIILHVFLGAFQQETSPFLLGMLGVGFIWVGTLHLITGVRELKKDGDMVTSNEWEYVCKIEEIKENRAVVYNSDKERIAIFKYDGKLSAVHNVCKHQNGPLGEGKIVDGCITCPWHGYQYLPGNGQSPPPFTEKVGTYKLKLEGNKVFVNPEAKPEGTEVEPVRITKDE